MKRITLAILTILICYSCVTSNSKLFKWKFDKFKRLTFKYEQVLSNKSEFLGERNMKTLNRVEGKLIVKVKNKNLADIVFADLKMTASNIDSLGDTSIVM